MHVAPERMQPVAATPRGVGVTIVLATVAVPFDPAGERVAIDAALETGGQLVLVNVRDMPHAPMTTMLCGPDGTTFPHEEARAEVRASAQRAADLGVRTLLLRVGTRHPARALLEVAAEQSAALLVFAPDRSAMPTRRFRRMARAIRRKAGCLVWVTLDDRAGRAT